MGNPFEQSALPRGALVGAGLLIAAAVVTAGVARWTGVGRVQMPDARPVASADLRFLDRNDGAVVVERYPQGDVVDVLPAGQHGFARGVLRGFARDRHLAHLGSGPPFRLVRWSDGRLSLEDPSTGRSVALEAFGPTNSAVFASMMVDAQKMSAGG
ncbi:MAG: photosynthetic complex assembly protein PuhC [Steroidobacteraceae bacterium]